MENLLDKIKVGDKVYSGACIGEVIEIKESKRYPIKVQYSGNIGIITYSKYGYQMTDDYSSDKISLIEMKTEEVKEIPININNLSLSELKNLQKDIEKKISEEENKYVDFTNVPIHQLIDVRIYEESNLHRKALYLSDFYNWELIKDNLGELCLLPTKKVK